MLHINKSKNIVKAAMIGALYVLLTYLQNFLFPGTTSAAIQFRASEALVMLALFSPTAICGLTVGCCIANIISGMPLDIIIGSFATLLATTLIYYTRNIKLKGFPVLSLFFPALCNGLIVGAEIQFFYIGGFEWIGFLIQVGCVALGEFAVSIVLGTPFYYFICKTSLNKILK